MKLIEETCLNFTNRLAAREPVPGGGGAAALIGALAAALCSMAGNYSTDKKSAEGHEQELRDAIDKAEELRMRLLALVDADAEAFAPLAAAWKLPKDEVGKAALQQATLDACVAPMDMLQSCAELVPALETIRRYGA
ncbi:MAG: cyclodeaminase/cyclohydrolase family protein [Oscillospiraceae bacterium]|nr:cyclodeaminase/cyclohydrolase family protein [Oscillospiraceae bacterium]